jgi:hypothetical protein
LTFGKALPVNYGADCGQETQSRKLNNLAFCSSECGFGTIDAIAQLKVMFMTGHRHTYLLSELWSNCNDRGQEEDEIRDI